MRKSGCVGMFEPGLVGHICSDTLNERSDLTSYVDEEGIISSSSNEFDGVL